jgi:hypothetical protein
LLSAVPVKILSPRKSKGGIKSAGGDDCEEHGAKVSRFFANYVQEHPFSSHFRWAIYKFYLYH